MQISFKNMCLVVLFCTLVLSESMQIRAVSARKRSGHLTHKHTHHTKGHHLIHHHHTLPTSSPPPPPHPSPPPPPHIPSPPPPHPSPPPPPPPHPSPPPPPHIPSPPPPHPSPPPTYIPPPPPPHISPPPPPPPPPSPLPSPPPTPQAPPPSNASGGPSSVTGEGSDGGTCTPGSFSSSSFKDKYSILFSGDHACATNFGNAVNIWLDKTTGCGFTSSHPYMFGYFSMKLKLVAGNSAGVVTTFYMSSMFKNHDELDMEFLGNVSGEPYILQTNIYSHDVGGREQRILLWFDPTANYHTYAFLWNSRQIVFYVDDVPIRVHRYNNITANMYPNSKPMYLLTSIWDGENWATRGGLVKTNWSTAPFVASYIQNSVDGCEWDKNPFPDCVSKTWQNWWDQPKAWNLTQTERQKLEFVRDNYFVYDYCKDPKRYSPPPPECAVNLPWA
ncbi:hypothetical protein O6H91_Y311200 [Diphasiastrum complanatum]|nr:hypothetical protein O6H91_Y311200 [Diphasiastrum complanatum]